MRQHSKLTALISLVSLFFTWGFITVMNDILVNTFQNLFHLSPTQRSLVQMSFFGAFFIVSLIYFLISSLSGKDPINKIGYNNGMIISLIITGIGCFSFYPAATFNSYGTFLAALFILATGVTLLQICSNPYAAIIGPPETASSRLNLAQGFNSLGTTIGPIVGTLLIYQIFSDGIPTIESVSKTYLIYGFVFVAMAMLVKLAKMPSFSNNESITAGFTIFKQRHLVLGIIAIFFYVGSEVSVGTWIVELIKHKDIGGLPENEASYYLSYFWGGLMIGRLMASQSLKSDLAPVKKYLSMFVIAILVFVFIYFATAIKYIDGQFSLHLLALKDVYLYAFYIALSIFAFFIGQSKPARSLVVFSIVNIVLLSTAMFSKGHLAMWSVLGSGLFFSIGWSNIFTLAIKDLGKYTSQGSSLLVMAIVGGAALPWIQSHIIQSFNIQTSYIVPVIGLLYITYYGWKGHQQLKQLKQ
ncbi:MAG: sugar MFS transporter [Bacteroidales bacterium]|nr:sugar MFS transporter [Bacteroidales bacterium]